MDFGDLKELQASFRHEADDCDVVTAVDGADADALKKLFSHSFDLVLTDINTVNMDRYEFIRQVRSNGDYNDLPVFIISSESEAGDKSKGFASGANFYIVKPAELGPSIENIQMVLEIDASPVIPGGGT
jgi:two-component system chemotaxis response regulator CheY